MPRFLVTCHDKPDHLALRMENRADHLAFLAKHQDVIQLAGPKLDEDNKPNGSILICVADDEEALLNILGQDPYANAGLFEGLTITPFKIAKNNLGDQTDM